jgi:DNA polymerase-3 subunit epsilon
VELVVMVSSSSPSWPYTTSARSAPLLASTSIMRCAIAGSETPVTCRRTLAGLASGPMKLNTVGTPSSRRGGPAWRMALW